MQVETEKNEIKKEGALKKAGERKGGGGRRVAQQFGGTEKDGRIRERRMQRKRIRKTTGQETEKRERNNSGVTERRKEGTRWRKRVNGLEVHQVAKKLELGEIIMETVATPFGHLAMCSLRDTVVGKIHG